ncbi:MAG: hypothetical protein Pg6C_01830 [Treponemataceae bacterium]|nr:MAG: hypothetical protein Pg6C_01830 [Treponemataceae bacterium]
MAVCLRNSRFLRRRSIRKLSRTEREQKSTTPPQSDGVSNPAANELAVIESMDSGKPIRETPSADVPFSDILRYVHDKSVPKTLREIIVMTYFGTVQRAYTGINFKIPAFIRSGAEETSRKIQETQKGKKNSPFSAKNTNSALLRLSESYWLHLV